MEQKNANRRLVRRLHIEELDADDLPTLLREVTVTGVNRLTGPFEDGISINFQDKKGFPFFVEVAVNTQLDQDREAKLLIRAVAWCSEWIEREEGE